MMCVILIDSHYALDAMEGSLQLTSGISGQGVTPSREVVAGVYPKLTAV